MDITLPETLLDIMESISKRNNYAGFKIYSSGCKTNIVIHFLDSTIISNSQSCETADNEQMQLKSYGSLCKKRSPCNQLRDTQRAKDHRNGHLLQDIDCQPKLVTQNSEESASECDNLLLSAAQENGTSIQ